MINIRKSEERGHANHGWLDSRFTFSFSNYYNPNFMGYRSLRVINEDWIQPNQGFGTHGHQDMEIVTYVIKGQLAHKDSTGGEEILRAGEFQRMTAGTGIRHSEFNPSADEEVHLLQIWILPESQGLVPGYEQKSFSREEKLNRLCEVVTSRESETALNINQDIRLFSSIIEEGKSLEYEFEGDRNGWLQLISGSLEVNGVKIESGDGLQIGNEASLKIISKQESEFLLFDLN